LKCNAGAGMKSGAGSGTQQRSLLGSCRSSLLDGSCGGSSGSGDSGSSNCQGFSGSCFLQGKDISLELSDEFVGLVRHVISVSVDAVASIDGGYQLEVAVQPQRFFSNAAIYRGVRDK
jgi:hypothetical protein